MDDNGSEHGKEGKNLRKRQEVDSKTESVAEE